jgi:hypothetical protein
MIELIIPEDLVGKLIEHRKIMPPEVPKYGFRTWAPIADQWQCFVPEVEDWIKQNIRLKDRRTIILGRRHVVNSKLAFKDGHVYFVQFSNDRDSTLFRMWWL